MNQNILDQGRGMLSFRLILMNFLQFAIWGSWLISLGAYLGGTLSFSSIQIGSFFATMGIAALFMPTLMGIVADKWIPAERLISICHILSGFLLLLAAQQVTYRPLYTYILLSVCFYMPTLGLTNSVAFGKLTEHGMDTVKSFPPIRIFGTIGFIVAMWIVDLAGFKTSNMQLYVAAIFSFLLALYMLTFKASPILKKESKEQSSWVQKLGLEAFSLFRVRSMAIFFVFCFLLGICLQITNSYANDYLTNYFGKIPEYADSFGVQHSGILISLSQISEALCILLIPFFLKRYGIKMVMMISFFAWFLRFGLLGAGNPGDGLWMLIISMVVYGVAFDFFNVSGALYVDQNTPPALRNSAQGVFLMMTNGLGSFLGPILASQVVEYYNGMGQYPKAWFVFAAYALVIMIAFYFLFHEKKPSRAKVHVTDNTL